MNTFLYVLLASIVVLFIANKLLARRKPNTVKTRTAQRESRRG